MRIEIPEKARYIIKTIMEAGFEAYVVGGCVRDSVLGRKPEDWDITTSAKPQQVKALFPRTIDTGIQHGTVTVMLDKEGFEVTTYRIDGKYEDSRHPKEVTFTPNLMEDLKRRDFTINAMAYNEEAGLVDIFGGMEDIGRKMIRCVGAAEERFSEDALRMMRAIRFSAQLGYTIEENTLKAISVLAPNLRQISAERIQVELTKLLVSGHPDYLRTAYEAGVTRIILPEFDKAMETQQNHPHHKYSVGEHTLCSLTYVPAQKALRLAMLFHDIGKPETISVDNEGITHFHGHAAVSEEMTKKILRRLRFDNETVFMVSRLVRYHDYGNSVEPDMRIVRRAVNKIGEDAFPLLFEVKKADILAQSEYMREEKLTRLERWQQLYQKVLEKGQCVSLKTLAVTGSDLIAIGMRPGKEIGEMLRQLLELVLENPESNTKELLLEEASRRITEYK
ncbi:MAG: CCA tRNA nucleotidyltransferase [Acetatifactor sp.]